MYNRRLPDSITRPLAPTVDIETNVDNDLLVLSFELRNDSHSLRFFSTITTFGTPQDITVRALRIESLFPADEATRQVFA